ncbi:MAG: hypothetical protein Q7T26_11000, partial [Dehalococcoidia bacterium]|nr:hypothetical protein [Dehalococcoidia bacterium]
SSCRGYFKITPGTDVKGQTLCHCPYCGHTGDQSQFATQDQIEYANSYAANQLTKSFIAELKKHEFNFTSPGLFGLGISLTVTGHPHPIKPYEEKKLETEVVCEQCTLRYAIYGVFALCPDCRRHNSLQILNKNLELACKQIAFADTEGCTPEFSQHLISAALATVVSAFDGFGRESYRILNEGELRQFGTRPKAVSFQNLTSARQNLLRLFGYDIAAWVTPDEWTLAVKCFQKRHLLAHKMGVVDEAYIKLTNDHAAILGRKIAISSDEIVRLVEVLKTMGQKFADLLNKPKMT